MDIVSELMGAGRRIFGSAWEADAELRGRLKEYGLRHQAQLAKLDRKRLRSEPVRAAMYHLLRSFDAKLCSLVLAWPKDEPAISWDDALVIARGLNPRRDCGEPVRAHAKRKANGSFRSIIVFGPQRRALQRLVRDALLVAWGRSPFDYACHGRGRERAMAAITRSYEKGGARWFLTADIKNCFASFGKDRLLELIPLPREVIRTCILIPDEANIILDQKLITHTSEIAVRSGIPAGSLASSFVAAKLLEPVLRELRGRLILSYADDIVAGGTKGGGDVE